MVVDHDSELESKQKTTRATRATRARYNVDIGAYADAVLPTHDRSSLSHAICTVTR